MKKNDLGGLFVAIDGPNGVGKSTLIESIKAELEKQSTDFYLTREPSESLLGCFTREIAENLGGESLACLVAADRYFHLKEEIIPQLKSGKIVITDRYILSSLMLQCMDGIDAAFVLALNDKVYLPDLQIAVTANSSVIQERLAKRKRLTRFEQGQRTNEEIKYLNKGKSILLSLGVEILNIENSGSLEQNVSAIAKRIMEARGS
jgi:dTMP kinase